jgi:hypothetical protein
LEIAYIAYASIMEQTGVFEKILCQVEALQSLGHKVQLIIIDSMSASDVSYNVNINVICNKFAKLGILSRYIFQLFVPNKLEQTLNLIRPDIIYFRYPLYLPFIGKVLYETKVPIVMEINGNPLDELQAKKDKLIYFIEKNKGGSLLNVANGFVGVSKESTRYALQCINKNIPHIIIGNGVDCNKIQFLNYYPENNCYNIVYIGNRTVWAGIDRLIIPLTKDKTIKLHLFGKGWEDDPNIKSLINNGQVINHDYVPSSELDSLLNVIDVGLGPLACHRKGFREATPLKVRRYLAHGIPVVIGYNDLDIYNEYEFVLKVPANDDPLDLDRLKSFAKKAQNNNAIRLQARSFALKNLDYKVKMERLATFLKQIVNKR